MTTSIDTVVLDAAAALKQPDVSRLTTASVDGTGVFDILMRSAKQHLLEEYNADRVTGDEYTKLYLGTMTAVMQTAVQYILNAQQEEKIQADIALVRQKTVTELAQTDNTIPVGLGFNGDTNVEGLVALEKEKLQQNQLLVDAQVSQTNAQVALTTAQVSHIEAQTSQISSQIALTNSQVSLTDAQVTQVAADIAKTNAQASLTNAQVSQTNAQVSLTNAQVNQIDAQISQIDSQIALTNAQTAQAQTSEALLGQQIVTELARTCDDFTQAAVAGYGFNTSNVLQGLLELEKAVTEQKLVTELANTSDIKPADLGLMTGTTVITGLVDVQKKKAEAENALLAQKTNTELAQTSDMVKVGAPYLNTSTTIAGVIGTQNALYTAQTEGFSRDAEQKVLKMLMDAWAMSLNQNLATPSAKNGLDDPSLLTVMNKVRAGIGVAPVVPTP